MTIIPVMYSHLLLLSLLIGSSSAQTGTCDPTSVTGPAIPSCPVGQVQDSAGNCCPPSGILTTPVPTTAAPVTTAAATVVVTLPGGGSTQVVVTSGTSVTSTTNTTCVDRLNPLTGVSDCPARASLCNDATYYSVMTVQCPRTCGRCSNTTTSTNGTCADRLNPQTGVSDCPSRISLCNSTVYYSVMTAQCPRTCGRCNGTNTTTTTTTTNGTCVDLTNPSTGISDCPSRIAYCTNSAYLTLMRTQCPRTCGFCTSTNSTTTSSVTVTSTGCADLINSNTGTSDCPGAAYLCNNASYTALMRVQCPRTCGFCSG